MKAALSLPPACPVLLAMLICSGVVALAEEGALTGAGRARRLREAIQLRLPKYQLKLDTGDATMTQSGERAVERDGVLSLPDVLVLAKKLPRTRPEDWLTVKGRLEMAMKRHPGLNIGNVLGLNLGISMAMLQEELDLEKQNELKRLGKTTSLDDSPENRALQRLIKDATTRPDGHWAGQAPP